MTEKERYEEQMDLIQDHAAQLAERFDSVLILVTANEDGISRMLRGHSGNWFACKGAAHAFIEKEQNEELSADIAEKIQIEEDDA